MTGTKPYRSEANRIGNKQSYKDLIMTHYPDNLDKRDNNENMRGFVNVGETEAVPDYVMAEYVNAATDAIMAIERALGTKPMVYHGAPSDQIQNIVNKNTVGDRLTRIENGLFDERYGGSGWTYVQNRPVLNSHRHDGGSGNPQKIRLVEDVEGLLQTRNINLNYKTGLTGAQISLSNTNPTKIDETIADLLSKTQGGTITGDTHFRGIVSTRTTIDATAKDINSDHDSRANSTLKSDSQATVGQSLTSGYTKSRVRLVNIPAKIKENLLLGKYALGIRAKIARGYSGSNKNTLRVWSSGNDQNYTDVEIGANYETIFHVFDQNSGNQRSGIWIEKNQTENEVEVVIDYYYILPIHPATLDI